MKHCDQTKSCPCRQSQTGFVLVLALVMLGVLTIIGVSSMNRANMELKASANSWQHQIAFNAANALHEYVLSQPGDDEIKYLNITQNPVTSFTVTGASNISATVAKVGCAVPLGSSLEEGRGLANNYFSVVGQASNGAGNAISFQNQGVRYSAASCPPVAVVP